MRSETVQITTPDGVADAYAARPYGDERFPAVLLIMDAFGLRPQIREMADRIADAGFLVLAPDAFYRTGGSPVSPEDMADPGRRGAIMEKLGPAIQALTPDRVVTDGGAYLDWLEREGDGPVAITGYCMGGRVGWQIATAYPDRVAALAAFHSGRMVTEDADSPHRSADALEAELYLGFADNDQSMPPEDIAALEQALDVADVTYTSEVYEGAAHGYTMADTPVYDENAAERHYGELFALLSRTIG